MKFKLRILLCGLFLQVGLFACLAHDNTTIHPRISESAAKSSSGLNNFLAEGFGYSLGGTNLSFKDPEAKKDPQSPIEWIKDGSRCEDKPWWRGNNHFYDPTKKPAIGLTDGVNLGGKPSFVWATVKTNASYGVLLAEQLSYAWPETRAYQIDALTNSSSMGRQTNLAAMLFYLGHVIHLNQDLTVPAHVRNDNHALTANIFEAATMWTEAYGKETYSKQTNGFPEKGHGWSWWQSMGGFQKLEDFWNRDMLRTNGADALNFDAQTDNRVPLGLSEFSNGNFISEDATYANFFPNRGTHWFQFPRLEDTTQPNLKLLRWGAGELEVRTNTIALLSGISGQHPYLSKTKLGIFVTNHSALHYEAVRNPGKLNTYQMHVMLTLNDSNVLQEYHSILIPKAIEYSAGILDYFFRGTIGVSVSGTTITIRNLSGQGFKGGTFFLFKDATNGNRSYVDQFAQSGTLPNYGTKIVTENDLSTAGPDTKYLLVYQGTIGVDGGHNALDRVDAGIGIAAKTFTPGDGGNYCDGVPINIQGFDWESPEWACILGNPVDQANGEFISGGTSVSFSKAGLLARVACLSNTSDCGATVTFSAHFNWGWNASPAFWCTTSPYGYGSEMSYHPSWAHWLGPYEGADPGNDNPQFWISVPAHSVTPVYLIFGSNNGDFSGYLSINY